MWCEPTYVYNIAVASNRMTSKKRLFWPVKCSDRLADIANAVAVGKCGPTRERINKRVTKIQNIYKYILYRYNYKKTPDEVAPFIQLINIILFFVYVIAFQLLIFIIIVHRDT